MRHRAVRMLGVAAWCLALGWAPRAMGQEDTAAPSKPIVVAGNGNLKVSLGGRIHRMVLFVDDALATDAFFTDSDQGPTMFKLQAEATPGDKLSIRATLELGLQQNRPFRVNQPAPDPGFDITGRIAEISFEGPAFGKFSLGRGFASAWLAPEMDLSGTQFAALLPVGMLAPGMLFVDRSTNVYSTTTVGMYFVDVERLLLVDRMRWDSPRLAGLQLSGSIAADGRWDTALRAKYAPGDFTVVAGGSYQNEPFDNVDTRYDGVVSVRHETSGVNLTVGGTDERLTRGASATSWIVKLGWQADLVRLGKTAFSLDDYRVSDLRVDGDRGTSWGLFAVQKWPAYGLEFYLGIRRYEVKNGALDLEPLTLIPFGVVFSF